MGITIVQKSDLSLPKPNAKIALVLAGGAISGGAFKLGGLMALDSFLVNRKPVEMDIYLGLSAGAFLAAPLAAGVTTRELLLSINGRSSRIGQLRPWDFYYPNWSDFVGKPVQVGKDAALFVPRVASVIAKHIRRRRRAINKTGRALIEHPNYTNLEIFLGPIIEDVIRQTGVLSVGRYTPAGLFDNSRIETFIRKNLEQNGVPNDFRLLHMERKNSLYIGATNLNTADGVLFGHDEDHTVSISQAVQASTAIPGFFKPAHINGQFYLDAGVRKTANISTAIKKGADLVIAYNPFRPYDSEFGNMVSDGLGNLGDRGLVSILNQTFRTLLHTRLHLGIEKLKLDDTFHGDVILIEPSEADFEFFDMSPLAFWSRRKAAHQGFVSTRENLERNYPKVLRILNAYGIECSLEGLRRGAEELMYLTGDSDVPTPEPAEVSPAVASVNRDEDRSKLRPRLKLIKGR